MADSSLYSGSEISKKGRFLRGSTRERILQAALELFSRKGFLGATTKEIASAAGVAEVTLFRHFPSKEDLFVAVINRYSFLPKLKDLLPQIKDLPEKKALELIAFAFLEVMESKKDLIKIMNQEMQRYPEEIKKIYQGLLEEILHLLSNYFQELRLKGILKEREPFTCACAFLSLFFSYFYLTEVQGWAQKKVPEKEKVVKEFVDIFAHGVLQIL